MALYLGTCSYKRIFGPYACFTFTMFSFTNLNANREIAPTIVTAIAEGNLNPSTKEPFDKLECHRLSLDLIAFPSNGQRQKIEVSVAVKQEGCLKVFGYHNVRENSTGKLCDLEIYVFTKLEFDFAWETDKSS